MRLACVAIFLLGWGLAVGYLHNRWEEKQQQRLTESNLVLATTYRASIAMYRLATETFVTQVVQRPEVINVFARGAADTPVIRDLARGKLYRLLAPAYAHLDQQGIHQLHFHTADGRSFLRFHAPHRYEDDLNELRPSVRQVNANRRALFGFELGRMGLGFHYLFPLFAEEQHIGSVETSVTFRSISEAMAQIDPGREYLLVLRRSSVERSLFSEQRLLYVDFPLHDEFLVEDPRLRLPVSPPPPSETVRALNALLRNQTRVGSGMTDGQPFAVAVTLGRDDWAVCFVPTEDISGENVGYLISYARAPELAGLRQDLHLSLGLVSLTLAGLFWLSWRLLQVHATLRQEKRQLQTVTDTIADGLYVMDKQGKIVLVNPAFTRILGFQPEEILHQIGHDLFHVHHDGNRLSLRDCPVVHATSQGIPYQGEELFRDKQGRLLNVELACHPMDRQGVQTGSVTAFRDISERKAAQERLLESDRIKSEFIATASHELRTPLTVIHGYLELLQGDHDLSGEQVREITTVVYEKALALERIIDDLLDVSRIETGRPLWLDLSRVDLLRVLRQTLAQFEKEAPGHRFSLTLPEQPVDLLIDKFKMLQVLENLLNNAVKFSPEGTEIKVIAERLADGFQIRVSDQGVGIKAKDQPHIFDKFHRLDNSNTAASGFGLGLYLAKRIVEAHHGEIRVDSVPGQGTTLTVTLPLSEECGALE